MDRWQHMRVRANPAETTPLPSAPRPPPTDDLLAFLQQEQAQREAEAERRRLAEAARLPPLDLPDDHPTNRPVNVDYTLEDAEARAARLAHDKARAAQAYIQQLEARKQQQRAAQAQAQTQALAQTRANRLSEEERLAQAQRIEAERAQREARHKAREEECTFLRNCTCSACRD